MSDASSNPDDPFERAVALHQAGDVAGAIAIYRDLLAQEGEDAVLLELLGAALGETGEFAQALDHLDRAMALDDGESSTVRLQRGIVREASGDGVGAIEDYRSALAADPGSAAVAERLGHALIAAGAWSDAVEMLDTTIAVQATTVPGTDPGLLALRRTRGDALLRLGRLDEAEQELDRVLSVRPEDETAMALRTRLLATRGDTAEALASARLAHRHHPESAALHLNLLTALASTEDPADAEELQDRLRDRAGPALAERDRIRLDAMAALVLGDADHAIDSLTTWTATHPDDVEALGALGTALRRAGRVSEAIGTLRRAVALAPQSLGLHVELGRATLDAGDADGAIEAFERAREFGGRSSATALELVNALKRRGRVARAIAVAEETLARHEDSTLRMARAMLLHDVGRHREAVAESGAVVAGPEPSPEAISNHLYGLQNPGQLDESDVVAQHRRLGTAMFADEAGAISSSAISTGIDVDRDRDERRPLRIGVVSGDLKAHSVAWFLMPLLRGLDPDRVATTCYSNTPVEDAVTERLRGASDGWRSILGRNDEQAATTIRDDAIDVLVDLSGHTGNNRLGVFRRRPAPVQATWLGYPNTTGIPEIEWRIVDRLTDPHGTDGFSTEALLRMRGPFLCFDGEVIEVPIPERPSRPVVFGSFNNTTKLSDRCLELWSRVLDAVPHSRLLLKSRSFEDDEFRKTTVDRLGRFGIARDRLDLRGFSKGLESHHRAYADMDIALDTFPYHGTTTTCEALWNGVPVVSRVGDVHRARVGLTLLEAVGLGELACEDDEAFVAAAVALASDRERLRHLHGSLRERMRSSPLCDGRDFAIRFEEAIRHAWRVRCRSEAPRGAMLGA